MDNIPSESPATRHSPPRRAFTHPVGTGLSRIRSWIRSWIRSPRARAALTVVFVAAALILLLARENPTAFFAARDALFPPVLPTPTPAVITLPTLAEIQILNQRPLRIPLLAPSSPCPTTPGRALDPAFIEVVGDGPVYVALGPQDTLSYAPPQNFGSQEWGGQTTFWAVQPGFEGLVLVRGRQVDGTNEVRFGRGDMPDAELLFRAPGNVQSDPSSGWTYKIDYTRLRAPGCYAYQIDGETFSDVVIFRAESEVP